MGSSALGERNFLAVFSQEREMEHTDMIVPTHQNFEAGKISYQPTKGWFLCTCQTSDGKIP